MNEQVGVIRPSVMAFAWAMEQALTKHDKDNPDGWGYCELDHLKDRLIEEGFLYWQSRGAKELIHMANFCMMIWHRQTRSGLNR